MLTELKVMWHSGDFVYSQTLRQVGLKVWDRVWKDADQPNNQIPRQIMRQTIEQLVEDSN